MPGELPPPIRNLIFGSDMVKVGDVRVPVVESPLKKVLIS
jgi:hypothetical protein